MASQLIRDGKKGSVALSLDIILLIIDHLIVDAKEDDKGIVWWLGYVYETPSKFAFLEHFVECDREKASFRDRFRRIQLLSQINRMSRALVHRKFLNHPMGKIYRAYVSEQLQTDAWILPAVDRFIPLATEKQEEICNWLPSHPDTPFFYLRPERSLSSIIYVGSIFPCTKNSVQRLLSSRHCRISLHLLLMSANGMISTR
ncbi:hypothetical protein BDP55DRAFT_637557 [Colletotrichum godetiae]|uniref:Uncharacterized protein n=1 Tax=Colletotrichum godetiae TaxID=1209918 RepID=A0AAJ0AAA9_9PEZI|nr:uncharacterized protein BDP55DRAFT_637557 [Colletotrichum godetiae]KAK1658748.1 hypothetical protein BDP55DRAFT_637557 [Colletotrichum godetiae]